jgi:hypothetical protein
MANNSTELRDTLQAFLDIFDDWAILQMQLGECQATLMHGSKLDLRAEDAISMLRKLRADFDRFQTNRIDTLQVNHLQDRDQEVKVLLALRRKTLTTLCNRCCAWLEKAYIAAESHLQNQQPLIAGRRLEADF